MKKFAISFCILLLSMCMFTACESDDINEDINNYEFVVINDDGSTSDGSVYIPIDMNSFYLDGVKYVIEDSKIIVSGYNEEVSLGDIKIPFSIKFRNVRYEVTRIDGKAFEKCSSLTSITISNSVTKIEGHAFCMCCNLTSVTIGLNLTKIAKTAFASCDKLDNIYCYAEQVPDLDDNILSYVVINDHVILHVPAASVSSYQKAIPLKWFFKEIVALTDNDPKP